MGFKILSTKILIISLFLLISLSLLVTLFLGIGLGLLYGYYYFAQHSIQQDEIFIYLLGHHSTGLLNADYLNIAEKRHLLDVKRLLIDSKSLFKYSFLGNISFLLLFRKHLYKTPLFKYVTALGFSTILASILLTTWLGFKELFTLLHTPFFNNNTWLFPKDSLLIQLFPIEYFYQFALLYVTLTLFILFIFTFNAMINI